jgi:hypothetical protein
MYPPPPMYPPPHELFRALTLCWCDHPYHLSLHHLSLLRLLSLLHLQRGIELQRCFFVTTKLFFCNN